MYIVQSGAKKCDTFCQYLNNYFAIKEVSLYPSKNVHINIVCLQQAINVQILI